MPPDLDSVGQTGCQIPAIGIEVACTDGNNRFGSNVVGRLAITVGQSSPYGLAGASGEAGCGSRIAG